MSQCPSEGRCTTDPLSSNAFSLWEWVFSVPWISELQENWDSTYSLLYFPSVHEGRICFVRRLSKRTALQKEGFKL